MPFVLLMLNAPFVAAVCVDVSMILYVVVEPLVTATTLACTPVTFESLLMLVAMVLRLSPLDTLTFAVPSPPVMVKVSLWVAAALVASDAVMVSIVEIWPCANWLTVKLTLVCGAPELAVIVNTFWFDEEAVTL